MSTNKNEIMLMSDLLT